MRISTIKILACCFLLLITGITSAQKTKRKNTTIPDIRLFNLAGNTTTLKALSHNKVTFIDNWFIPCPPCSREMPLLHELYAEYKANPEINFITICATDPNIVKKFLANDNSVKQFTQMYHEFSGLSYFKLPVYFIPGCNMKIGVYAANGAAPDDKTKCPDVAFGFKGYPSVYIFNKKGQLIYSKTGYVTDDYAAEKARLKKLLTEALSNK